MDLRKHTVMRVENDFSFEFILQDGQDPHEEARKQITKQVNMGGGHENLVYGSARISTYDEEWDEDELCAKDVIRARDRERNKTE